MILTAQDAIIRFQCVSAYVQTDEISLVSTRRAANNFLTIIFPDLPKERKQQGTSYALSLNDIWLL